MSAKTISDEKLSNTKHKFQTQKAWSVRCPEIKLLTVVR